MVWGQNLDKKGAGLEGEKSIHTTALVSPLLWMVFCVPRSVISTKEILSAYSALKALTNFLFLQPINRSKVLSRNFITAKVIKNVHI